MLYIGIQRQIVFRWCASHSNYCHNLLIRTIQPASPLDNPNSHAPPRPSVAALQLPQHEHDEVADAQPRLDVLRPPQARQRRAALGAPAIIEKHLSGPARPTPDRAPRGAATTSSAPDGAERDTQTGAAVAPPSHAGARRSVPAPARPGAHAGRCAPGRRDPARQDRRGGVPQPRRPAQARPGRLRPDVVRARAVVGLGSARALEADGSDNARPRPRGADVDARGASAAGGRPRSPGVRNGVARSTSPAKRPVGCGQSRIGLRATLPRAGSRSVGTDRARRGEASTNAAD